MLRLRRLGRAPCLIATARRLYNKAAEESLVDCSKVLTRRDPYGGVGAFAATAIKAGEVVERGVVRRLPVDGNKCPFVFTWSEDRSVWAHGSGASIFYNASLDGGENTTMVRHLSEDKFEIVATRDIAVGEEVTHLYKSIDWRECFTDLKAIRDSLNAKAGNKQATSVVDVSEGSLMDCSKVYAKQDAYGGIGVFAKQAFKKGDLIEFGTVRRVPVDGFKCPFVFTWGPDRTTWATGSGCSIFYNASLDGTENTESKRFYEEDRFEIYAIRDIAQDEELTQVYHSIDWRPCFKDLKEKRDSNISNDRANFRDYWNKDFQAPTLENMMLDSDAGKMDVLERPEILSELPSLAGKRVLELGAGIGRFTAPLLTKAGEVVAVDFVESSCLENQRTNSHLGNLKVIHADVTQLQLNPQSFDLVFSNWLLMYLTDSEVSNFAMKALQWLRPGGILFFRESCVHASGNHARRMNPTKYRDPESYSQLFSEAVLEDGSRFQLLATNCVESYEDLKGNVNQMWFRWIKVQPTQNRTLFLQTGQYTPAAALRYEKIYGRNYIYTGGEAVSKLIAEKIAEQMRPGARCLDVGCGLGGGTTYMAETFPESYIHGVTGSGELAALLVGRRSQHPPQLRKRVTYELMPELGVPENEMRYPPNSFDTVVLRETLMYFSPQDKAVLLRKLARMLRPGGRLVVVDYCSAAQPTGEVGDLERTLGAHLDRWGYRLVEAAKLQELLEGYFSVETTDMTESFISYLGDGLSKIDEHFGPNAPQRRRSLQVDLDGLRAKISTEVGSAIPEDLGPDASQEAANAAIEQVKLHLSTLEAEAERCAADHQWASQIWTLEKQAAEAGILKWVMMVATKKKAGAVGAGGA